MNVNRVNTVLVTNKGAVNTGTSLATIADGDLLVLNDVSANLTGTPVVSDPDNRNIVLALGLPPVDNRPQYELSSKIIGKNIVSWTKQDFVAPAQKVMHVGYDGTSGALALQDSKEYRFRIILTNSRHYATPHEQPRVDFYYSSGATADNYAAANSIVSKINNSARDNRSRLRGRYLAEVTADSAFTEFGAAIVLTLTNGSRNVSSAAAHGLSVGDFVRLDGSVYQVATVPSTTSFTLDRNFSGLTAVINPATTVDVIGTLAGPTSFGIRVTALPIPTRPVDLYQVADFDVFFGPINGLPDEAEAKVTTQNREDGQGYWEQVRDMEFFAAGYKGITNRRLFPIDQFTPKAVSTGQYRIYIIDHTESTNTNHHTMTDMVQTVLAFDVSTSTAHADEVEAILDSYIASTGLSEVP